MYAFVQDMPGVTLEDQAAITEHIDLDAAPGFIAHVVGPIDGGCRIVDVWENEQAYRTFQRTQLWPALQVYTASVEPGQHPSTAAFSLLDVTGEGYLGARA
jgi:hypothetical protein